MSRLTFKDFQRSRRRGEDLSLCSNAQWENVSGATAGFVYLDCLCIKQEPGGSYHLTLGNEEWICDELQFLERRLYDFAIRNGFVSRSIR